MKNIVLALLFILAILSCTSKKSIASTDSKAVAMKVSDTVKIENDSLEYEVIIIDSGFNTWLAGHARPRGYYSETYLENKNRIYVTEWNSRVNQSQRYSSNLYEMRIDYDQFTHYGYEVNYLMYNYFIYFQITYNQKLAGFVTRP
jgi:Family of unknown function (DUF6146)